MKKYTNWLDKIFSLYIRLRNTDDDSIVRCFTCGKVDNYINMDCGHYQGRQYKATRYDEINCQVQCKACNKWGEGMKEIFAQNIDIFYGKGTAEKLRIKKNNPCKMTEFEYIALAKLFTEKLIDLYKKWDESHPTDCVKKLYKRHGISCKILNL